MNTSTSRFAGTVYLIDSDLPNGPYLVMKTQTEYEVHISFAKATVNDVKIVVEKFAADHLARQSQGVQNTHVDFDWHIETIGFKGGSIALTQSLTELNAKSGDAFTVNVYQKINFHSKCLVM